MRTSEEFDKKIRELNLGVPGDFKFRVGNKINVFVQAENIFEAWGKMMEQVRNNDVHYEGKEKWRGK